MKKTLVILAAGMGSRFGGLKQMESVGPSGETLLDYAVYDAIEAGFEEVLFVIRSSFAEAFKAQLTSNFEHKIQVSFAFQELNDLPASFAFPTGREKPWGTGHALLSARHQLKNPFAVINADDFYGRSAFITLAGFLNELNAGDNKGCLVGYPVLKTLSSHGPVSRGLIATSNDRSLKSISEFEGIELVHSCINAKSKTGEEKRLNPTDLVSVNCFGFSPAVVPLIEKLFEQFLKAIEQPLKDEFYLPAATTALIGRQQLTMDVLTAESTWMGVTYREDQPEVIEKIKALIEQGEYPQSLWV